MSGRVSGWVSDWGSGWVSGFVSGCVVKGVWLGGCGMLSVGMLRVGFAGRICGSG